MPPSDSSKPFDNKRGGKDGPKLFSVDGGKGKGGDGPSIERSLPFSDEAERGSLSSLLQAPGELLTTAAEILKPEHFYVPSNRLLFETMMELGDKGAPVEPVSLTTVLSDNDQIEMVGGAAAIADLYSYSPTPAHFGFYANIVEEKHRLRSIILACTEGIQIAYESGEPVDDVLDQVEQSVYAIREDGEGGKRDIKPLKDHVSDLLEFLERVKNNKEDLRGCMTGFKGLDDKTNGLQGGQMVVIAARPSMGKTSFIINMAENAAVQFDVPVAVFSCEMPSRQIVQRVVCSQSDINMHDLLSGELFTQDTFRRLAATAKKLGKAEIYIDDTASPSIVELRAKVRRMKKDHDIGLVVVDYLQLLKSTSRRAQDNRQIEIAEISGGLKALALELDIPVVVAAQLNRQVENRKDGRPQLSDLRESGSIEQDADMVGLLWRDNYAGGNASFGGDEADSDEDLDPTANDGDQDEGKAILFLAKNRNGPTGDCHLWFQNKYMRFVDRDPPAHD